ncbi:MAG TPA: lysylphosphatidylglycerol synthase transmembrane domain-containing protein [Acidimicrobiales bacterium]|nr:lysylphosphatidylglycerol synthase transmembrane domain-containing protein [Acidimicrobiales bacterium]
MEGTHRTERKSHRPRWLPSSRIVIGLAVLVALLVLLFHAHSISHDAITVLRHFRVTRLPWLALALAAEALSFLCYALVQRSLLEEGGARLSRRDMVALAIAATGLTNLLPGGTAPSSGWLVAQYRKRGIPMPLALWAVLAGGVAATMSVLILTLAGAAIAGLLPAIYTVLCAVLLLAGSIGFIAAVRHLDSLDRWFRSHHRGRFDRLLTRFSQRIGDASKFRTKPTVGARVLVLSLGNWGLDVGCLIAAFALLGLNVPWRTVLFAYAFAQIAGSLAPVPGGIGFVEGGMVGAFALAGTPVGGAILATILYRLITSVGVAGIGSIMLLHLSRQKSTTRAELSSEAAALNEK